MRQLSEFVTEHLHDPFSDDADHMQHVHTLFLYAPENVTNSSGSDGAGDASRSHVMLPMSVVKQLHGDLAKILSMVSCACLRACFQALKV